MRRPAFLAVASLASVIATAALAETPARLAGRVVDADGSGVAAVTVSVVEIPAGWELLTGAGASLPDRVLATAATDEVGAFALDAARVPKGLHALRLEAPGRPPLLRPTERVAFGGTALPQRLELVLPPAAGVAGIVLDELGRPARKASLRIAALSPLGASHVSTRAGDDGRFNVEGLPAHATITLAAEQAGASTRLATRLPSKGAARIAVHLARGSDLAGTVLTQEAEPKPVGGARIVVSSSPQRRPAPWRILEAADMGADDAALIGETATAPDGTFRLSLPEGAAAVLFQPGYAPRYLEAGRNLVRRVAPVTGVVVSEGKPVASARVRLRGHLAETVTAADGSFTLPFEQDELTAWSPWGARASATVRGSSVRLEMPRARTLRARVVTQPTADAPEGRPMADALVRISVLGDWHVVTATDADGRCTVEIPLAAQRITAVADGLAAEQGLAGAATSGELRLVAAPAAVVAASLATDGRKAAGALALVHAQEAPASAILVRADAKGVVQRAGLVPGQYRVIATAEGTLGADTPRPAVPASALARVPSEVVELPPAGRLRVRCLDGEGRPIEGVAISARTESRGPRAMRMPIGSGSAGPGVVALAGTGADGIAVLDSLTPGECVRLQITRPGLSSRDVDCARPEPAPGAALDVVLERGATIRGLVQDPAGLPLPFARVIAMPDSATAVASGDPRNRIRAFSRPLATATADAAGRFALLDVRRGRVELSASAEGFLTGAPVPADVLSGDDIEVELRVEPGASLTGTVKTASGGAADGARVVAVIAGGRGMAGAAFGGPRRAPSRTSPAGADGSFTMDGLDPAAEWTLEATLQGDRSERKVARPGGEPVTLVLSAKGRIEGRVLGLEDSGQRARMRCIGAPAGEDEVESDPDGTFLVGGLDAGTWKCQATAGELGEGSVEGLVVRDGEPTSALIRLGPRAALDVLVRDASTGEPMPGARVWASWDAMETTDAEGRARVLLSSADGGSSTVRASAPGRRDAQVSVPTPAPATLELRLEGSATIRGVVLDADGSPVAGINVTGGNWSSATSGSDGRFEVSPRAGETRIQLRAERSRDGVIEKGTVDVDVGPDGADGIVLRMERLGTGSALVVVVDGSGPLPGAQVMLVHESSPQRRDVQEARMGFRGGEGQGAMGLTDTEGSFLAEGLRTGELAILVGRAGEPTLRAAGTVDVANGSVAQATVRVPGGGLVTGRVVRGATGLEGWWVSAVPLGTPSSAFGPNLATTTSGAAGAFELGPLPESVTRVLVRAMPPRADGSGDRVAAAEVDVAGAPVTLDVQGVSLTGRVSADGQPVAGATVRARGAETGPSAPEARTTPDGGFVLVGLTPGLRYDVSATLAGRAAAATAVTAPAAGSADVGVLELGAGELTGTASAASGRAVDGFQLALVRASGARMPFVTVRPQPDGTWRTPAPAAERLEFRASTSGFGAIIGVVEPGDPLALAFPQGAELTLEIAEADGRPAPGATARLVSWNGRPADEHLVSSRVPAPASPGRAASDERGVLVLQPVTAGTSVLSIEREGRATQVTVTLADGDRQRVAVRLPAR